MQDQLVVFMALAGGMSRVRCGEPTLHTRTAMVVAEQMLPGVKFAVKNCGDGTWLLECQGAGLRARGAGAVDA